MTDVPLDRKVSFLRQSSAYSDRAPVEAIETHMSWVFLEDGFAWKMKKPVRYDFLDFSTLDARQRCCEEEIRLNRRFAPSVYLGVVPLTLARGGWLALDGGGEVVEWLVRMRRLPAERMLDRLIREGRLARASLVELARMLARFYRDAPREPIDPADYLSRFARELADDAAALVDPVFGFSDARVERVFAGPRRFLREQRALLASRASLVVEGHGDLRPEHVCLDGTPKIIDGLEFNRELRLVDPADELAFLSMECARLGAPEVRGILFTEYEDATGDRVPREVVDFYAAARSALRAKLAIWHMREPGRDDGGRWLSRAADYLRFCAAQMPDELITAPAAP